MVKRVLRYGMVALSLFVAGNVSAKEDVHVPTSHFIFKVDKDLKANVVDTAPTRLTEDEAYMSAREWFDNQSWTKSEVQEEARPAGFTFSIVLNTRSRYNVILGKLMNENIACQGSLLVEGNHVVVKFEDIQLQEIAQGSSFKNSQKPLSYTVRKRERLMDEIKEIEADETQKSKAKKKKAIEDLNDEIDDLDDILMEIHEEVLKVLKDLKKYVK